MVIKPSSAGTSCHNTTFRIVISFLCYLIVTYVVLHLFYRYKISHCIQKYESNISILSSDQINLRLLLLTDIHLLTQYESGWLERLLRYFYLQLYMTACLIRIFEVLIFLLNWFIRSTCSALERLATAARS